MPKPPEAIPDLRSSGTADARRSNNAHAKERDQAAWEFLDTWPATSRQLVIAKKYPHESKARQRLRVGEKRGLVRFQGLVNITGFDEKLWARFNVSQPSHEGHVTEVLLAALRAKPTAIIRRGFQVDHRLPDAELDIDGRLLYFELDMGTMGFADILKRITDAYDGCIEDVLWVFSTNTRIDGLFARARKDERIIPPNHWFTTFQQAVVDFHRDIWINSDGDTTHV